MQRIDLLRALLPTILEPFGQEELLACYDAFPKQLSTYIKGWRPKQAPRARLLQGIGQAALKTPAVLAFFSQRWLEREPGPADAFMKAAEEVWQQTEATVESDGQMQLIGSAPPNEPVIQEYISQHGLLRYVRGVLLHPATGLDGLFEYYPTPEEMQALCEAVTNRPAGDPEVADSPAAEAVSEATAADVPDLDLKLAEAMAVRQRYVAEVDQLSQELRKLRNKVLEADARAEARQNEVAKLRVDQKVLQELNRRITENKQRLAQTERQVKEMVRQAEHLQSAVAEKEANFAKERSELLARVENANSERDQVLRERNELESERDQVINERLEAIREREALTSKAKDLRSRILSLTNEASALKSQLEMARKTAGANPAKLAANPDLEKQMQEQRAYSQDLLRMMAGLEAERDELRQKVQQFKQELDEARSQAPGNDDIDMDSLRDLVG